MGIIKNAITFGSGFNITAQGPIDSRQRVETLSDLTTVWGADAPSYKGMLVVVLDTGDLYQLIAEDATQIGNWKKIGSGAAGDISNIKENISSLQSGKADKFTVGNGLSYSENKVNIVIDPESNDILSASEKGLKVVVPDVPEYVIEKLGTAENGYAASYQLKKDGELAGVTINIPKDMVVSEGSVKTVEQENTPYEGAQIGDVYIDLVIANADSSHLYIPANKLVDEYTGSTYITVEEDRSISLNYDGLKSKLDADLGISTTKSSLASLTVTVGTNESGLVKDVTDLKTNLNQKVDKVEGSSLITSEKLALIDTNASEIAGVKSSLSTKLDNTATVNGQAFVEGACTIDATQINIKDKIGTNIAGTPVESVLKDLDSRITSAVSGGLTSVTAGNGIEVSGVVGNSQTVSVKKDAKANNMVEISTSGLFVPDMNAYWEELA